MKDILLVEGNNQLNVQMIGLKWQSSDGKLTVSKAIYNAASKIVAVDFSWAGPENLAVWDLDSPMGGNILEDGLTAGDYTRTYVLSFAWGLGFWPPALIIPTSQMG